MNLSWSPKPPVWSSQEAELLPKAPPPPPPKTTLATFLQKSDSFPRNFPVDTPRCKALKNHTTQAILERNINSAFPLLHENILHFYAKYILIKRQHGNPIEKQLFKRMTLLDFIERLLTKRAATFIGKQDRYTLLDGKKGSAGWENIGTTAEKAPLLLKDYISYEEVKLSAFLSVSSYTHFVNIGDRKNFAKYQNDRESIQEEGVIVGIVGPRLIKTGVMDYEELVVTADQNRRENGYGPAATPNIHQLFADLYEEECLEHKAVLEKLAANRGRYLDLKNGEILDNLAYYKRVLFTIDALFVDANHRAKEQHTTAYIHVVGIGLGVWKKSNHQNIIFMDTCAQRILSLGAKLSHVSDICFAYINHDSCGKYKHGDMVPIPSHPLGGIKVYLSKREPHARLTGADSSKLLVVSYAWDGNALPGNEFWLNKLGSSGDSAAASSTQISELHNAFINPNVSAANLRVVTHEGELLGFEGYVAQVRVEDSGGDATPSTTKRLKK